MSKKLKSIQEFVSHLTSVFHELRDANDHFYFVECLRQATSDYKREIDQSPAFWSKTIEAHVSATMSHLCRVYDDHPVAVHLIFLIEAVRDNRDLFCRQALKERLRHSPACEEFAECFGDPVPEKIEAYLNFCRGSPTFSVDDFVNLPSLASKLMQIKRPVDTWLAAQLSTATQVALANYLGSSSDQAPLRAALLQDLNAIVPGSFIYNVQRFDGVNLRSETQDLLSEKPRGDPLLRLNRLLLEDAYPLELSRNPLKILWKWRHNVVAHLNKRASIDLDSFQKQWPLEREDIQKLISKGCGILNRCAEWSSALSLSFDLPSPYDKDYKFVLEAMRGWFSRSFTNAASLGPQPEV